MQFGKDTALRLLIVDDSVEAAEAIVSGLRNGGIAVRPSRPENEDELASADRPAAARPGAGRARRASTVPLAKVDAGGRRQRQGPARADAGRQPSTTPRLLDDWSRSARAASSCAATPTTCQTRVRREWADLEARRALRRLEAQLRETERRCDALIDSSRDPIAYIHEGMHIRANQAYLEMFGFESFEDIEGMSLLDLIAPQHVDGFKQLLKQTVARASAAAALRDSRRATLDGSSFPAVDGIHHRPATRARPACRWSCAGRRSDPELAREVEDAAPARPGHRPAQPRRPSCARSRTPSPTPRRTPAHHGLLLIEPDHFNRLLQDIGLDAADDADRRRWPRACARALGAGRRRRALRRAPVRRARAQQRPRRSTAALAESVRAAFADHVLEIGDRSLSTTVSIGGVQIGEKIASVTAGAGQGQPGPAVGQRRGRQPHRAVRPGRGRPRRGRARRRPGSRASATRSTATASCCTTSR